MRGIRLTNRQSEALDAIRHHIKERNLPPSRAELAKALGIKYQGSVDNLLSALARKGWVRLFPAVDRGIQLLREGAPLFDQEELPEVAAGNPQAPGNYPEPKRLHDFDTFSEQFGAKPDYFLKVRGDSMDKLGLKSGDIVAMQRTDEARNGSVVVARIGEDITLKRLRRTDDDQVFLDPLSNNPENESIRVDAHSDFQIAGVVVGAIVSTVGEQGDVGRIEA